MITFRYHVVTLVAVFMAIGLGVLFGATFIDQNIVDGLRAAQVRLGDRNESLRDRILELERQNEAVETFASSTRDLIVRGALEDVSVVLVSFEGTPGESLDAVRQTLTLAGGRFDGHVTLSDGLDLRSEENRERLAAALGSDSDDAEALSQTLVTELGTALLGQNPNFLSRLVERELASTPVAIAAPLDPAPVVVVVGGDIPREVTNRVAVPLLRLLGETSTVAAAAASGTEVNLLRQIRGDSDLQAVTVDSIDTPLSQSALAIGLRAALAGQFGHYGLAEGATTALPVTGPG
ncbi:MAG TPA: copper transporter [Actinomycetota bacterium]|nr:copper transporter [Actinomycetota bacterium]